MALPTSSPFQSASKSALPSGGTGPTIESRLAALEKVIQVATDGSVVIKGATSIKIEAGSLKVRVGASVDIESMSAVNIKSSGFLDLRAAGAAGIRGAVLTLNGGALPLARVNDPVTNGRVVAGNNTVLA